MRSLLMCMMLALALEGCAHVQEKANVYDLQVVRSGALTPDLIKGYFLNGEAPEGGLYRNITASDDGVSAEIWSGFPPKGRRMAKVRISLLLTGNRRLGISCAPEGGGSDRYLDVISRALDAYLVQ